MVVSRQLNYTKTRRFHAIFMPVIIEFSRCIGTYSSAKFELLKERKIIVRHAPIENKCMDISQQTGSKRKSVSEIKNIL